MNVFDRLDTTLALPEDERLVEMGDEEAAATRARQGDGDPLGA